MKNSPNSLSLFVLVMLVVGAIDSIRNMPTTALFGPVLLFFFALAALFFLIPTAMISSKLAAQLPKHEGIYDWVTSAFGDKLGFLTIWLQWINTMVWYPTILSFIAGTLAYLIDPQLASHKLYLVTVILGVYWALTWISLKGLHVSAKFASSCAVLGLLIPVGLIIGLALYWVLSGHPVQVHFNTHNMLPSFSKGSSWISLTAIMTSFLGIELAAVHVRQIKSAKHNFPKAMLISVIFILVTMLAGSLAIAFVIPAHQINLVSGVMQAFSAFLDAYHIHWLLPVLTLLIIISTVGSMVNWMISPAKGLLIAGKQGYLPKKLCEVNKQGAPGNLLIAQAVLVSMTCLAFLLMPSVNGSYWLLTDLSTELYMMMYVLMFVAAIALIVKKKLNNQSSIGWLLLCVLGILGSVVTIIIGFIPPNTISVGGTVHYVLVFAIGILLLLSPTLGFYFLKFKRHSVAISSPAVL